MSEILSFEESKEIDILKVIQPGETVYLDRDILRSSLVTFPYKFLGAYHSYDDDFYLAFRHANYVRSIKHSSITCTYWHRYNAEKDDYDICYDLGLNDNLSVRLFDPVAIRKFDIGFHSPITDFLEVEK